ncbi:MAG: hypothetical protein WCG73_01075 [Candidatus Moraniibacteriota bacterium]
MYHSLISNDYDEEFSLAPLTNEQGQPRGFILTMRTDIWPPFIKTTVPFHQENVKRIKIEKGLHFTKTTSKMKTGNRFGFRRGIRIASTTTETITLHIFFHEKKREVLSTALNLNWLLDFFFFRKGTLRNDNHKPYQLFEITSAISLDPGYHGSPVTVNVGSLCSQLLDTFPENFDFPQARNLIAKTYGFFGIRLEATYMQAYVRKKGILQLSAGGNCNCLGENPDNRDIPNGYMMSSHNTDTPLHQVTLLIGLAHIWTELHEAMMKSL